MYPDAKQRIDRLMTDADASTLTGRRVGLEKESLRVAGTGEISRSDHPASLGSALCNRTITTDFSEALLEMVTPPLDSSRAAVGYLDDLHRYIAPRLPPGEHLWNASMPCILRGADSIRIAEYGTSHNARMKHVYRRGLALRYGKRMQVIAGIHFNFSLPAEAWVLWQRLHCSTAPGRTAAAGEDAAATQALITEGYFHMTRNLLRIGWLVPYLFGASPAICQSFLADNANIDLDTFNLTTRYARDGTSLRMGDIGYQYRQDGAIDLSVRHDDFDSYLDDLQAHVTTEHPPYQALGLFDAEGRQQQLNAMRLQIENEYYSSVRPKQIPEPGEMPILALRQRGIRYLELRSIDIDLSSRCGVRLEQVAVLELLMLFAWLCNSPALTQEEMVCTGNNMRAVAQRGRQSELELQRPHGRVSLREWGHAVLDVLEPLAALLDEFEDQPLYVSALHAQRPKLADPAQTPSAVQLEEVKRHGSFFECVMATSGAQHQELLASALPVNVQQSFDEIVRRSLDQQQTMEATTSGTFEDFLSDYFDQLTAVRKLAASAT